MDKTNSALCGNKAKSFEPLATVADWLISNPNPGWYLQLKLEPQVSIKQSWRY